MLFARGEKDVPAHIPGGTMNQTLSILRCMILALVVGLMMIMQPTPSIAQSTKQKTLERALGIGGFFFRAQDPKKLGAWYEENLGIKMPVDYDTPPWRSEAGTTVFTPFAQDTKAFGDMKQQWMINFRVRSLDAMAAQLRAKGVKVEIDPQTYPNGRFGSLADPEGNPIQLWQPGGKDQG